MQGRRTLRAALAIAGGIFFAGGVQAAAPMVKGQAPGYYHMMLGNFEVTALSDGTAALPIKFLTNGGGCDQGAGPRLPQGSDRELGERLSREHGVEARPHRHRRG